MLITWGLFLSAHVGIMSCVHARPCWGGPNTPTHAKYSHATLWHTSLPCVPFNKILTKQTGHTCWPRSIPFRQKLGMYTYFMILKLHIDPYWNKHLSERSTLATIEEPKKSPALGLPLTLDRLLKSWKVYSSAPAYSSILPCYNQYGSGVLTASMASTWVTLEVATCNEVVCPGELPVGLSSLLSHGPRSLSAAHWRLGVEPPHMCSPSSPTRTPSRRSSLQWGRAAILVNRHGACTLQSWGPHSLLAVGPVSSLPSCMCWAQCCCCSELSTAQHTAPSSQILATQPVVVSPQDSPHVVTLRTQAVGVKTLQAAEWPADLAPVCFNCWQSTGNLGPLQSRSKKNPRPKYLGHCPFRRTILIQLCM
jgi:hypothetical protein